MKQKTVRLVAMVLAAVILLSFVISGVISTLSLPASAASSSQIRDQLNTLNSQKKKLQNEIDGISDDIDDAYAKKTNLEQQINVTVEEIRVTNQLIEQLDTQISQKQLELEQAQKTLDEQKELFKTRVRVMCENGNTSYLDLLLTSGDFSELLTRVEMVNRIMDYDQTLITRYTAAKQAVEDAKTKLETDRAEQTELKVSLENKRTSLKSQQSEVDVLVNRLNTELKQTKEEALALEREEQALEAELKRIAAQAAQSAGNKTPSGSLTWPCPAYKRISSPFGYRNHPTTGTYSLHTGTDMSAATGANILAAKSGTVIKSVYGGSYGNYVMIDHGDGMVTLYAHMSQRLVSAGQSVSAGQVIGLVGSTGRSTGPHLHFTVIVNGEYVNPMNYFN